MTLDVLVTYVQTIAWATYVGGSITMELVWRPVQRFIPPPQTNVVCQKMGRRYRWLALGMLALIAITGSLRAAAVAPLSTAYVTLFAILAVLWLALVAIVGAMATSTHPALHVREGPALSAEERRARVKQAIRRMDTFLRAELAVAVVALAVHASLSSGKVG